MDHVSCKTNAAQSYALYIPMKSHEEKQVIHWLSIHQQVLIHWVRHHGNTAVLK